jgi:hypothetical protein
MKPILACAALAAAMISWSAPALSAIVTSLDGATSVEIPIVAGDDDTIAYSGPVTFGPGITLTSTRADTMVGYTGSYGFTPDGDAWEGTPMVGLNRGTGTLTLSFATPLAGFLAEINSTEYAVSADATVSAYDAAGNLLDTLLFERNGYRVEPGYWGFRYASPSIARITFSNEYIGFRNISVVAAVPEPGTWMTALFGFGAVGAALRRRARIAVTA